ncbi:MAG: hypothetical protein ACXW4O_05460 [Candidatus Binatia bacterium]
MDQISHEMGINPVDMFIRNRIQKYKSKIPFTSNYLGCFTGRRNHRPGDDQSVVQGC